MPRTSGMNRPIRINVILPKSLHDRVKKLAYENRSPGALSGAVSRQIRLILEEYLNQGL
jgi:hypothetical protein